MILWYHGTMKRKTHPGLVFFTGLLLLAVCCFVFVHRSFSSDDASLFDQNSVEADRYLRVSEENRFWDEDTLVVTERISRLDPDVLLMGADIEYSWPDSYGDDRQEWTSIPTPGFGTETWYISTCFRGMNESQSQALKSRTESDYAWTDSLYEYSYLSETADREQLVSLWHSDYEQTPVLTLDQASGSFVSYTVSTPDHLADSLYGEVLVEFMDGDTCVFAGVSRYEGVHETDVAVSVTYQAPCALPYWTEVRLVPLY